MAATEHDAVLLNTSGTVAWEFASTWPKAMADYFPRYSHNNIVKTFYTSNVPYVLPTTVFGKDFFKIVGGRSVVFRPREWRGPSKAGKTTKWQIDVDALAAEINGYPPGTVSQVHTMLHVSGGFCDWWIFKRSFDEC